ncbi:MAG: hypothetical protein P1P87_01890 [Trueperaceae bacterium]|nr:hypothetical protein [Trueperaceae bacterium]
MFILDHGTIQTCVDALEFDLERWHREAARERMLHGRADDRDHGPTPGRRTDRPSWHQDRHGTPHPTGAH